MLTDPLLASAVREAYYAGAMVSRRSRSKTPLGRHGKTPATIKRSARMGRRTRGRSPFRNDTPARKRLRLSTSSVSRSRGRTAVGTKGTSEYAYSKSKSARPRRVTLQKLVKVSMQRRILRFQHAKIPNRPLVGGGPNNYVNTPGSMPLRNLVVRIDGTQDTYVSPVHMYCLNSTQNTSATPPQWCGEVTFVDNGQMSLGVLPSISSAGNTVATARWQPEWQNYLGGSGDFPNLPNTRYIATSWYDIRMLLYGANNQPTQYEVMVVQFKDAHLDPFETPSNAKELESKSAFYHEMCTDIARNPILTAGTTKVMWSKLKILYRKKIDIAPSTTDEEDQTGNRHYVKIYIPDGSVYDYAYTGNAYDTNNDLGGYDRTATDISIDNRPAFNKWNVQNFNTIQYSDNPKPRARKYLIVRALNTSLQAEGFSTVNAAAPTSTFQINGDNTPSYDIMIRKKEAFSASMLV